MTAIGREDLVGPEYKINSDRVRNQEVIEKAISDWTSARTPEEVLDVMSEAQVPSGRICAWRISQKPQVCDLTYLCR